MRLDALETEDTLTQRATNKNKKKRGGRRQRGIVVRSEEKVILYFGIFHSNHKSTCNTARPPNVHLSVADCHFSLRVNNSKQVFANWTNIHGVIDAKQLTKLNAGFFCHLQTPPCIQVQFPCGSFTCKVYSFIHSLIATCLIVSIKRPDSVTTHWTRIHSLPLML